MTSTTVVPGLFSVYILSRQCPEAQIVRVSQPICTQNLGILNWKEFHIPVCFCNDDKFNIRLSAIKSKNGKTHDTDVSLIATDCPQRLIISFDKEDVFTFELEYKWISLIGTSKKFTDKNNAKIFVTTQFNFLENELDEEICVVCSRKGEADVCFTKKFTLDCSCVGKWEDDILFTIKIGHFVVQVFNLSIPEKLDELNEKSISYIDGNKNEYVLGSLVTSAFAIDEQNRIGRIFSDCFNNKYTQQTNFSAEHRKSTSKLWLHLMDGLGFPEKYKCNIVVKFELIEQNRLNAKQSPDCDNNKCFLVNDDLLVKNVVTSSCSVHARHLVWDQKMEMILDADVMQDMLALLNADGRPKLVTSLFRKCYIFRVSMWKHNSSRDIECKEILPKLIASVEKDFADILSPFIKPYRQGPSRNEIIFPLQLHDDSPDYTLRGSQVRLRVGVLLISDEGYFVHEDMHVDWRNRSRDAGRGVIFETPVPYGGGNMNVLGVAAECFHQKQG